MTALLEPPAETDSANGTHELVAANNRSLGAFRIAPVELDRATTIATAEQADSLRWFARYFQSRGMNRRQVGTLLHKPNGTTYSADSIYQALTGRRGESGISIEPIVEAIDALRRTVERPAPKQGFIETEIFRRIQRYCARTRKAQRFGFIVGDMNMGKSESFRELARRDANVIDLEMPVRGHLNHTLKRLGALLHMGARQTVLDLSERIIEEIPPGTQLIVDDADQPFYSIRNALGMATFDFFRQIYDRHRISIVFGMDTYGYHEFTKGENAHRLRRVWRRRIPPLFLPTLMPAADLALFAGRAGLDPAPDENVTVNAVLVDEETGEERTARHTDNPARLQQAVIKKDGLGVWLSVLSDAAEMAREQRRPISWAAVIKAHAMFYVDETGDGK